jgi:hypothetical protein
MNSIANKRRQELTGRLHKICEHFRFHGCRPALYGDEEAEIAAVCRRDSTGRLGLLIGIACSHRLRPALQGFKWSVIEAKTGAPVMSGTVKRGNHFRIDALEECEYQVTVDLLAEKPVVVPSPDPPVPIDPFAVKFPSLHAALRVELSERWFALAAATDLLFEEFHSDQLDLQASVRETPTDQKHTALTVEVALDAVGDRIVGFQFLDVSEHVLARGYLGLYEIEDGKGFGQVLVDVLVPGFRGFSPRVYLQVFFQSPDELTATDREVLERSLDATDHPDSREMLARVLQQLRSQPTE